MQVDGKHYRTIWLAQDGESVDVIDQSVLPHAWQIRTLHSMADAADAIASMCVRGAPLIGATGAYGMALAMRDDPGDAMLEQARATLNATRPTAVNLQWALDDMVAHLMPLPEGQRIDAAYERAAQVCDDDVNVCESIGEHGLALIRKAAGDCSEGTSLNILTHCNAGWLATVDWGTALAPIYKAHDSGIPLHVWVDETRPRNQGAHLTAWELGKHGVPFTVIADNVGGHLMQRGQVDMCIVGSDRTTATGDVCNKIGTYLKALAAADNDVPFYVALPHTTIDWTMEDGVASIPIEERDESEVHEVQGRNAAGGLSRVRVTPPGSRAANYGFDVTPARYVTGLITERGDCAASADGLRALYPERC